MVNKEESTSFVIYTPVEHSMLGSLLSVSQYFCLDLDSLDISILNGT